MYSININSQDKKQLDDDDDDDDGNWKENVNESNWLTMARKLLCFAILTWLGKASQLWWLFAVQCGIAILSLNCASFFEVVKPIEGSKLHCEFH